MEINHTITMTTQPETPLVGGGKGGGKKKKKVKAPGGGEPQNSGQNQNQQKGQGGPAKKSGNEPKVPKPTVSKLQKQTHGGKTGLGLGEGKKYDQNTCLFISGAVLKEEESALKFVDNLLIDRMNLDFRATEVKRIDIKSNKVGGPKCAPPPLFAPGGSGDGGEADKIIVAILTNPAHVQEILRKAPAFKNSPENYATYGHLKFEGYLSTREQQLKAAMVKRVDELNRLLPRARIGAEVTELQALVTSKNTYKHLGLEYSGEFQGENIIVWKNLQIAGGKGGGQNKSPQKGKGGSEENEHSENLSKYPHCPRGDLKGSKGVGRHIASAHPEVSRQKVADSFKKDPPPTNEDSLEEKSPVSSQGGEFTLI